MVPPLEVALCECTTYVTTSIGGSQKQGLAAQILEVDVFP